MERARARIAQIRQEKKVAREIVEAELCSFDYSKALDAFKAKSIELSNIIEELYASDISNCGYKTTMPTVGLQQFRDTHPEFVQFEHDCHLVQSDDNKVLSFAAAILRNTGVNRRIQEEELTENEMNDLFSKADSLYRQASSVNDIVRLQKSK